MSEQVLQDGKIFVGKSIKPEYLDLKLANRHGLITGATGTGKTVTLQVLAEGFSRGGRAGVRRRHQGRPFGHRGGGRAEGFSHQARGVRWGSRTDTRTVRYPTIFWDVFGEQGHPIRATVAGHGTAAAVAPAGTQRSRRKACSTSPSVSRRMRRCRSSISKDLRAMMNNIAARSKEIDDQVRQRRSDVGRRHPAASAGARGAGRQPVFRRAGARHQGFHSHRRRTAAASSTCSLPTS